MKRLYDVDPGAGRRVWFHEVEGGFVLETQQETKPIIDWNKHLYNAASDYGPSRWDTKRPFHSVANIPTNVYEKELLEKKPDGSYGLKSRKFVNDWLNDPSRQVWRTRPGRVDIKHVDK